MDPFIGLFLLLVTVFSSFPLVRSLVRDADLITALTMSFVLGLSAILLPLYLIGILLGQGMVAASWIILLISCLLCLGGAVKSARRLPEYLSRLKNTLINASKSSLDCVLISAIVFLVFKYIYMLSIKGIFDWDAVGLYLPFGRRIFETDSIPLFGYDYQPVMSPIGISVLYAWIYSLSGSPYAESFRLFPVLFAVVTMVLIYRLGKEFSSARVAKIAVVVYALLPLHDAALFYASYYPDLCYLTLVLASFFFMCRHMVSHRTIYCLFGGISMGLSFLMKLQTAYLLPATAFLFVTMLSNRHLRLILAYLLMILIGFGFIYFAWPDAAFFANLPATSQILAGLFVVGSATLALLLMGNQSKMSQFRDHSALRVLTSSLVFYGTVALIAGMWFLRNYLLTGSFMWSSGINEPDYQWAVDFIHSSESPAAPLLDIGTYFVLLLLIPATINVLGMWIVMVLVGVMNEGKSRKTSSLIIIWMIGYWIGYFWSTFHHFEVWYTLINPRDLYTFAPFFSLFAAIGIVYVAQQLDRRHERALTYYMLSCLGIISLAQSLLIYSYGPAPIKESLVSIASLFGVGLDSLAWQYPRQYVLSVVPSIIFFALCINVLIVGFVILSKLIMRLVNHSGKTRSRTFASLNDRTRKIIAIFVISSLVVVPDIWLTYEFSGGDLRNFGSNQLSPLYGGLFTEVGSYIEDHAEDGNVVLMCESLPLQYYLHKDVRVLALNIPGNLAILRGLVESTNSSVVLDSFDKLGVRYVILSRGDNQFVQYLSNKSILLDIVRDPAYFQLITFQNWYLYELIHGRKQVVAGWKDDSFISNWTYIEEYSTENASWSFISNGDILTFSVSANATVTFGYAGIPLLNTTQYEYVTCRVSGSDNARWSLRLYSQLGEIGYDFPHFGIPSANWWTFVFDISDTLLCNQLLGQQAYLSLQSVDSNPATLYVDFYAVFGYESV